MTIGQIVLTVSIFNLTLAFYVWKTNWRNPLNICFGIFAFFVGSWVFLNYIFINNPTVTTLSAVYAIGPYIIVSGFPWIYLLKNRRLNQNFLWFIFLLYSISVLFTLLFFLSNQMITSVNSAFDYQTGLLFNPYMIFMSLLFTGFITFIIYQYLSSSKELKRSFLLIAVGMIFVVLVAAIAGIIMPALGLSEYNFLDSPSSIFFVVLAGYAIIRHQLLNIKVAVTEIIVYFLLVMLFITLFVFDQTAGHLSKIILMLIIAYGGILLINSVKEEIERRKEVEQLSKQLKKANKRLKQLDAMKSEFVSVASHELLTPISAIEGYLSMILDEKIVKIEDEKAIDYLNRVYDSARRLAKLVADLLNVSRIEQGRLAVEKKRVEAKKIIDSVVRELKFKAQENKQKLTSQIGDLTSVYADSDKIKEVLINLSGNAIKFTPKKGRIKIGAKIWSTKKINDRYQKLADKVKKEKSFQGCSQKLPPLIGKKQLVIWVKDNGIGISEKDLAKLFEKFSRLDSWQSHHVKGTGLGLYISKALILLHYGRIWAESAGKGKGSSFFFSLPLAENQEEVDRLDKRRPKAKNPKPLAKMAQKEL